MDLINKYLKEQTPGYEYEYNYEGDMAKTQLNMMIDASMELKSMLANDTNLPEWVQSKITKAADYVDSARDYMKNMNKDPNGSMGEDVERKDTGWQKAQTDRKDQFGNRIKNVARRLARQGMQAAVKDLKKGPEAGKRQVEEVEELDEISKDTLKSYADKSIKDAETRRKQGSAYEKLVPGDADYAKTFYKKSAKRLAGATKAMSRLAKEEVEELDELKEPTVQKYITRAKFSTDPKRRAMAQKAQSKLQQKQSPMKKEDVDQIVEVKVGDKVSFSYSVAAAGGRSVKKTGTVHQIDGDTVHVKVKDKYGVITHKKKTNDLMKEEVEELEELKRSTLASYTGKAADQMAHAAIDKSSGATMGTMGRMSNMPDLAKKGSDKEDKSFQTILKRTKGITSASRRLAKEEADLDEATPSAMQVKQGIGIARDKRYAKGNVTGAVRAMNKVNPGLAQHPVVKKELQKQNEDVDIISKYTKLGEGKYGAFRVRRMSGTFGGPKLPRRSYVPQGDSDPRTGLPLGFSNPPKLDKPETEKDKVKNN